MRLLRNKRLFIGLASRGAGGSHPGDSPNDDSVTVLPVGKNLPEKRAYVTTGDLTSNIGMFLAPASSSGASVNEASAMGVPAVMACVSLISDMVAKLPIELLQNTPQGPQVVNDHPAVQLLNGAPSELHTSFELRKLMMTGKLLGGNGYARVFREPTGEPRAIQWEIPTEVSPMLIIRGNGERFVTYQVAYKTDGVATRYDMIHIKGECRDGAKGISSVAMLRESIGTSITQTEAAGNLMKNGAKWPGIMKVEGNPKPDDIKQIRDEINLNMAGAMNAGRIPVVGGAMSFMALQGMSMTDAQFIESRRFELQEIARHYRIPPFLIGDSTASTTWGTGIEQQTLGFLNFCLDPHLVSFEQALNATLLTTDEIKSGMFFRFDRDELASVSRQDTAAYFQTMRNIGVYSVNDIRRKLDEPTISAEQGGDDYSLPLNSSSKGSEPAPKTEKKPEPVNA